ncbi:MAG: hypothetical protein NTZ83_03195 [Candidatus Pacearchaeota archaeon]|nr:hypothetical protein [Candidatus Pacearchaeota archaeon]
MKITPKIIILSIVLILLIAFISFKISGLDSYDSNSSSAYNYNHSWTKAICNETHCQDYEIYCNGEQMIRQSPITGAVISIPKGWEDPRNETMRERVCNTD